MSRAIPALFAWAAMAIQAGAISPDNPPSKDNSVAAEQAAFQVHEDFEISLFADESLGIANPIALHWDERGRLWVLCTLAYAQLRPGEVPDDKLFILEDTDDDGRADKSTVFADGLDMPMGFALGHGGAWVAVGPDLVHLRDTDGDGRADEKRVVLTGFGTGDTHQNISNLIFDAGGFLYFSQGLHTFSQVETPWGVARGDTAGFWRFDPRTLRLSPFGFPSMTSQNPCGVALDKWGALLVKSNGPHLCFAVPGLIPTTHPRELMQHAQVGQTPGKSMGVDIVDAARLPGWIQNHAVIAGYFAREVSAIPLVAEKSGFAVSPPVRLVYGGHESFRPVDIRQGPDGAIYVADWFNPIINHYQVSLRHPDRDYTHGRVWRLSKRGETRAPRPSLTSMGVDELVSQLRSADRWLREQARRLLQDHPDGEAVTRKLSAWIVSLEKADAVALMEAAGVLESRGALSSAVLDTLQASPEPHARAAAARHLARTADPVDSAVGRLEKLLGDPHPRVRLEAVVACANRPEAGSLRLALRALDAERDKFIDYALGQAVFALEPQWLDRAEFEKPAHLAFVLETFGGETAAKFARQALAGGLGPEDRGRLSRVLAKLGNATDLARLFDEAAKTRDTTLLDALAETAETRRATPDEAALRALLAEKDAALRVPALRLAGGWRAAGVADLVESAAFSANEPEAARLAALRAFSQLGAQRAIDRLAPLAADKSAPPAIRRGALEALPAPEAARSLLSSMTAKDASAFSLLPALLSQGGGPAALAAALEVGSAPDAATAQEILNVMNRLGRTDTRLTPLLNRAVGRRAGAPEYDPGRVEAIVAAIRSGKADVKNGEAVYRMPRLACVACHRVGDAGGVIGPSLNGVGAGLPLDQIVESILWPERQIKEGFQAVSFTTVGGQAITGYIEREGDDIVWYRNMATPWILPLAKKDIARREAIPTLMPPGLTQELSEEQLRDLAAYLASLKG